MKYFQIAVCVVLTPCVLALCDDEQEKANERQNKRLEFMRKIIEAIEVKPVDPDSKLPTRFNKMPILRFGDSVRETTDGTLWKLGTGRPQAIVGMEFQRIKGKPHLGYEFLCLTKERFELHVSGPGWKWIPSQSALDFKRLDNVRPPHDSAAVRLRQMKQLARRFTATEKHRGQEYALRLLPQPIDQYVIDQGQEDRRGAVFILAHGTNPEVVLLIEPIGDEWQYALGRLAGAEIAVKLDDQVVWTKVPLYKIGRSWVLDYTIKTHLIESPQLNTDE